MPSKRNHKPKIVNDVVRNKCLEDYRYHQKIACLSEVLKESGTDNVEVAKRLAAVVNAAFDEITP